MNDTRKKTVAVQTVGCRLNQYETERMAAALYPYGFRRVRMGEQANLCIINTCTVTHRADSSSRHLVQKAVRENPDARIVVAGCYVNSDAETVAALGPVDVLISNEQKPHLVEILSEQFPDLFEPQSISEQAVTPTVFDRFNRTWLKISDGCNQRCAYCILPMVRGQLLNRPAVEIIDEVRSLMTMGFEEIVLTGLNIGYYRDRKVLDPTKNLAALCTRIMTETDLPRLRLSSIEPQTVRDELLRVIADSGDRICRHMHLPMQSGSTRLLRIMRRPYDQATYLKRITDARAVRSNTIIGADIIVGFPGETDEDFRQSVEVAESGQIDYLHVFSYSDRRGTMASELGDKVKPDVIKERNAILSAISRKLKAEACRRQVGETLGVISEHVKPGRNELYGISDNYLRVKLPVDFNGGRHIHKVRITTAAPNHVSGEILGPGTGE
ncbi:MAG: tRNA (N(6)-L-threonylcarbamoyladenosine(37)-C(2))-methylthiotransferase MtaB [candidate division Zixibacteria bacterium]|nr:tRNA (N(6)-L-threonylcarbamoyladenosine(37)-C(2))-methylthiotransferase MtaB [candidate division Zixibacteria bacterium]